MPEEVGCKVRLLHDVAVGKVHGLRKGKVVEVVKVAVKTTRGTGGVWVLSNAGAEVRLWRHEYEVADDESV